MGLLVFIIRLGDVLIDDLRAMAIFAETIKQGSFKGAANKLNLSPSVVSYHVSQLEARVGNALIYRSTRKLSLTSEGEVLFRHAETMLGAAELGLGLVSANRETPSGVLRITVPTSLTRGALATRLAAFKLAFPDIELIVTYTDTRQDLIEGAIDLAVRVGRMGDSALMARHIGEMERKLVCSPAYYEAQPKPEKPEDLGGWDWIRHSMLPGKRTLVKGEEHVSLHFSSSISVNNVDAMAQLSLQGLGLSTPPVSFVEHMIESGDLVEVLPNWTVESIPIYAVWPGNVSSASNAKLLLNHLLAF